MVVPILSEKIKHRTEWSEQNKTRKTEQNGTHLPDVSSIGRQLEKAVHHNWQSCLYWQWEKTVRQSAAQWGGVRAGNYWLLMLDNAFK